MRLVLIAWGLAVLVLASTANAVEPTRLRESDRAEGALAVAGAEAGFAFHALGGTELKLTVKSTDGNLEPEILVYDPDDVRIEFGGYYRHTAGSGKAKLRTYALPSTGCYTIVVRGIGTSTGSYKLKLKAEHDLKVKSEGSIAFFGDTDLVLFAALESARLSLKVKGRDGFQPLVRSVLQPNTAEVNVPGIQFEGTKVTGSDYRCPTTGEYRLRIESALGTPGSWKSKIKLVTSEYPQRTLSVDGQAPGTFTSGMNEPGTNPSLPVRDIRQTAEFFLTLSILNPAEDLVWHAGGSMALMVSLQNRIAEDIPIRFRSTPWNEIVIRSVQTSEIVWRLNPVTQPFAVTVTFPWSTSKTWSTVWSLTRTTGGAVPAGEYDIVATFDTDDVRIPQEARIRIEIE